MGYIERECSLKKAVSYMHALVEIQDVLAHLHEGMVISHPVGYSPTQGSIGRMGNNCVGVGIGDIGNKTIERH